MDELRKAAEMACDDWENDAPITEMNNRMIALRQALARPEQEPVAYYYESSPGKRGVSLYKETGEWQPLYTAPPHHASDVKKREWVGLTDDEIIKCFDSVAFGQVEDDLIINKHVNIFRAIRGIEAKLKRKNCGGV